METIIETYTCVVCGVAISACLIKYLDGGPILGALFGGAFVSLIHLIIERI